MCPLLLTFLWPEDRKQPPTSFHYFFPTPACPCYNFGNNTFPFSFFFLNDLFSLSLNSTSRMSSSSSALPTADGGLRLRTPGTANTESDTNESAQVPDPSGHESASTADHDYNNPPPTAQDDVETEAGGHGRKASTVNKTYGRTPDGTGKLADCRALLPEEDHN